MPWPRGTETPFATDGRPLLQTFELSLSSHRDLTLYTAYIALHFTIFPLRLSLSPSHMLPILVFVFVFNIFLANLGFCFFTDRARLASPNSTVASQSVVFTLLMVHARILGNTTIKFSKKIY